MRRTHAGSARTPSIVPLGKLKYLSYLLLGSVVFMGLVNPILVSLLWLFRGLAAGEILTPVIQAIGNSLFAALLAAVVAVILALPLGYLAERFSSIYSRITASSAYIGFGMPGIAVALSLVFFGARHAPWVYQTMTMLTLGYMVRYAALAVGPIRAQLAQTNTRMEGSRPIARLWGDGSFCTSYGPCFARQYTDGCGFGLPYHHEGIASDAHFESHWLFHFGYADLVCN